MGEKWSKYRSKKTFEIRPYEEGENLNGVKLSSCQITGSPKRGDMVVRNSKDHNDQWLISEKGFDDMMGEYEKEGNPFITDYLFLLICIMVLVILQIMGIIDYPWYMTPFWFPVAIVGLVLVGAYLLSILLMIWDWTSDNILNRFRK
jgi:magnesium-transporting ATPase (P-type)